MTTETDRRVAAHTPGKWMVFENGLGVGVTACWDVAHCSGFDDTRDRTEELANARLIAAAPDLLAFAVALDADWTEEFPDGPDTDFGDQVFRLTDETLALWRQCRAVILRAIPEDKS